MRRGMIAAAVVLLAVVAALVLLWPGGHSAGGASEAPAGPTAVPGTLAPLRTALPKVAAAALDAGAVAPRGNELPRPATSPAVAPVKLSERAAEARPMPTDRREHPGPRSAQQLEILSYGFETLDEDIEACLKEWRAIEPERSAEVMIGFELDKSGLTRSWVDNADDIPLGPRSCLANAVYGLDWSNIVDEPAKVTNRFRLSPDAGSAR